MNTSETIKKKIDGLLRFGWSCLAMTFFLAVMAGVPALSYGATGTLAATSLTGPAGIIQLGNDLWVSDHILGFCRLDPGAAPGTLVINTGTCSPAAPAAGQPSFDAVNNFVYLPDNDLGVVRLTFNPLARTVGTPVTIAAGLLTVADLPIGSALGPDGNLYVSYIRNGTIERITNPTGAAGTQTKTTIGTESAGAGGGVLQLAFVGTDLYLTGSSSTEVIANAPACGANACTGTPVAAAVGIPTALVYDGSTFLYISRASSVFRYNPATQVAELYVNGGTIPPATTVPFQNVSALGLNTGAINLYVADDPTAGAQVLQGRLWQVATNQLPGPTFTGTVVGALKSIGNLTGPAGLIFLPGALGGHFWISDHLQGFCRLDPGLAPGTLTVNPATCSLAAVSPAQPSFDPAKNFIYLPDSAGATALHRLNFNPGTETIIGVTAVAPGLLNAGDRMTGTALGPDGKLYVSFIRNARIQRVTTPGEASQTVEDVGFEPGGLGTNQLTFIGGDLYLAGLANLSSIANVAACTGACVGTIKAPLISAPATLAYDRSRYLYVGDIDSVWRYDPITQAAALYSNTGINGVTPVLYQTPGSLAFDPQGSLYGTDDPSGAAAPLAARLWEIRPYLLSIKDAKSGKAGETVSYTLSFKNTSGAADTFNLTYTGNVWTTTGPAGTGPLAIDAGLDVVVQVTIPPGVSPKLDTVTVTATSVSNASKFTVADLATDKTLSLINLPVILR
jgi:sugar lactone lactonase YvrE